MGGGVTSPSAKLLLLFLASFLWQSRRVGVPSSSSRFSTPLERLTAEIYYNARPRGEGAGDDVWRGSGVGSQVFCSL